MAAEQAAQQRIVERLARAGVTFLQPATARIEAGVEVGEDTTIGPGVTLAARPASAPAARSARTRTLIDTTRRATAPRCIQTYAVEAEIGPTPRSARSPTCAPAPHIGEGAKVGTFVEIKNSNIGAGAKVPHLSYIGDADVGEGTNLGASTITANYDGRSKHRTKVGKSVKTSVHTTLVAPVTVGDRAYTGAGSVINEDVPTALSGSPARGRRTSRDTQTAQRRSRRSEQAPRNRDRAVHVAAHPGRVREAADGHRRPREPRAGLPDRRRLNVELIDAGLKTFTDGEVYCRYAESIRGADIFIVAVDLRLRARGPDRPTTR